MGKATISIDYGTYTNLMYKKPSTDVEMTWEAPDDLEEKYVKQFDDLVTAGLTKLEKTLSSGVNKAKQWLEETDKKIGDIFSTFLKSGQVAPDDVKYVNTISDLMPGIIENLEKQRVAVFESMLDGIISDAIDTLVKKLKLKATMAKVKKVAKIVAFAVLALTAAAVGIASAIVTFGATAPLILALVSASIGGLGTLVSVGLKTKQMWSADKNESKNLTAAAKTYAQAVSDFNEILERQASQIATKKAQLAALGKQIDANAATMDKLEVLSKKADLGTKAAAKLEEAKKAQGIMMSAYEDINKDIAGQEKLLNTALDKKSFDAAKKYADSLSGTEDFIDKINDQGSNLNTALSTIATMLSAFK